MISRRFAEAERRTGRAAEDVCAPTRVLSRTAVELSRFAAGAGGASGMGILRGAGRRRRREPGRGVR